MILKREKQKLIVFYLEPSELYPKINIFTDNIKQNQPSKSGRTSATAQRVLINAVYFLVYFPRHDNKTVWQRFLLSRVIRPFLAGEKNQRRTASGYKAEYPRKNARSRGTLFSTRKGISRVNHASGVIETSRTMPRASRKPRARVQTRPYG